MTPNFMVETAKIIAEIRNRTCIEDDVEVIKGILQDELKEYYDSLYKADSTCSLVLNITQEQT